MDPHGRFPVSDGATGVRPSTPRQPQGSGYFITRLIQPLVLFSPFTTQLRWGRTPASALSTALPTSSSSVLIREANALMSCWRALARFQIFWSALVLSRPAGKQGVSGLYRLDQAGERTGSVLI